MKSHGRHSEKKSIKIPTIITINGYALVALVAIISLAVAFMQAYADSGIDVSNWQGCSSEARSAQAYHNGARFMIIKASEGLSVDKDYACTVQGASHTLLRLGSYHYARPEYDNPISEADLYSRTVHNQVGSMLLALDWEPPASQRGNVGWAKAWLDRVYKNTGVKPLLYMSASTLRVADWSPIARADYGLWVAGYPAGYKNTTLYNPGTPPYPLAPWSFAAAWQYSSTGLVAGYPRPIDVDWFYGDAMTWAKYASVNGTSKPLPQVVRIAQRQPQTIVYKNTPPAMSTSQLADQVMRGVYGNGLIRRRLLGARYHQVMAQVNKRYAQVRRIVYYRPVYHYYVVRQGDTLSGIGYRYGRTVAYLVAKNHIRNPNIIYPGQRIYY